MILVILGTHDINFERPLKAIDKQIKEGKIKDKVVVQAGYTKFKSEDMEIFDFVSNSEMQELMKKADLIVTHGGVGSIIESLKNNKKIIAFARLKKYKECANDHQIEIIKRFKDLGYILELENLDELYKIIKDSKKFKPKEFISNTDNMIKLIENYIDNI